MELEVLQAQTQQNCVRLLQVEGSLSELQRKLDDYQKVTEASLVDLRRAHSKACSERRFLQTLRSQATGECVSVPSLLSSTSPERHAEGDGPAHSETGTSVEGADSAQISVRLAVLEASCQTLRSSVQDVASVLGSTERMLRAEVTQEIQHLRGELAHCCDSMQRLQETQEHRLSKTTSVQSCMQTALDSCSHEMSRVDQLYAIVKSEVLLNDSMQLELKKVRDLIESTTSKLGQQWLAQKSELLSVQDSVATCSAQLEAASQERDEHLAHSNAVRALLQEQGRRLAEVATLTARLEAMEQAWGSRSRLDDLECSLRAGALTPALLLEATEGLRAELREELERTKAELKALRASQDEFGAVNFGLLRQVEANVSSISEVRARLEGLEAAHRSTACDEAAVQPEGHCPKTLPRCLSIDSLGTIMPFETEELRKALATTSAAVATLAHNVAQVQSEHASMSSRLGMVTESVAKAAATSIQRVEVLEAMVARCKELYKTTAIQSEALDAKLRSEHAEVDLPGHGSKTQAGAANWRSTDVAKECTWQFHVLSSELRAEAASRAAALEARLSAAEAIWGAGMKHLRDVLSESMLKAEATAAEVDDFRMRLSTLEVLSRCSTSSAPVLGARQLNAGALHSSRVATERGTASVSMAGSATVSTADSVAAFRPRGPLQEHPQHPQQSSPLIQLRRATAIDPPEDVALLTHSIDAVHSGGKPLGFGRDGVLVARECSSLSSLSPSARTRQFTNPDAVGCLPDPGPPVDQQQQPGQAQWQGQQDVQQAQQAPAPAAAASKIERRMLEGLQEQLVGLVSSFRESLSTIQQLEQQSQQQQSQQQQSQQPPLQEQPPVFQKLLSGPNSPCCVPQEMREAKWVSQSQPAQAAGACFAGRAAGRPAFLQRQTCPPAMALRAGSARGSGGGPSAAMRRPLAPGWGPGVSVSEAIPRFVSR